MCFQITLKVTENQDFTLSLEETFFEKPQGEGGGQFDPHRQIRVEILHS